MKRSSDSYLRKGILRASGLGALAGAIVGFLWGWVAYGALEPGFMAPYVIGCAASFSVFAILAVFFWNRFQNRPFTAPVATGAAALPGAAATRKTEVIVFFLLAVVIWPFIAIGIVGAFGFLVWMWQMVFGPPGPPN